MAERYCACGCGQVLKMREKGEGPGRFRRRQYASNACSKLARGEKQLPDKICIECGSAFNRRVGADGKRETASNYQNKRKRCEACLERGSYKPKPALKPSQPRKAPKIAKPPEPKQPKRVAKPASRPQTPKSFHPDYARIDHSRLPLAVERATQSRAPVTPYSEIMGAYKNAIDLHPEFQAFLLAAYAEAKA